MQQRYFAGARKSTRTFATSLVLLALQAGSSLFVSAQSSLTTTTVFQTVENQQTVTSILGDCATWQGVPLCEYVRWSPVYSSYTPTTQTGSGSRSSSEDLRTSSPTPSSTTTPTGSFVVTGEGTLSRTYLQFDDTTGTAVLASLGEDRFVQLLLDNNGDGLLQNALDLAELAFLRYNASVRQLFPQEDPAILSVLRQVRHGHEDEVVRTDFTGTWFWNGTISQLQLTTGTQTWLFYISVANSRKRSGLAKRATKYDIYMLPQSVDVPADSSLQQAVFVASDAQNFSSQLFSSSPPGPTASTSTGQQTSTDISTSTTNRTSRSSSSSTHSSETDSSSSSTEDTSSTGSSDTSSPSSVSSPTPTPDAYDIITSFELQAFCTSLLSYYTPSSVLTSTSTDLSTTYIAEFTSTAVIFSSTTTLTATTAFNPASITSAPQRRSVLNHLERDTPSQLTAYPSASISSACARAATSPSSTDVSTSLIPVTSTTSITTSSTLVATTSINDVTTSTDSTNIYQFTFPAIGKFRIKHSDLTDTVGTFYNWYLRLSSSSTAGEPIYLDASKPNGGVYDVTYAAAYSNFFLVAYPYPQWALFFNALQDPTQIGNIDAYKIVATSAGGSTRVPFVIAYDTDTLVGTPYNAPYGADQFFVCRAAIGSGPYTLYYGPSGNFSGFAGWTGACSTTDMDVLQGDTVA
ncbi:hypothetical protein TWF696_004649 [Orbilia brochopaga]|uniref:Uncharacterized protein n=1 Tax=Orbilia brochopaga TaxID=3140254 RepID=A0AAV9V9J0_9PEZI